MTRPKAPEPIANRDAMIAYVASRALAEESRESLLAFLYTELLKCGTCKRYVDCWHRERDRDWAEIERRRQG